MDTNIGDILRNSIDSIREIADINTIIGDPIKTDNGTTIIPVSKVSLGFASGGVDFHTKDKPADNADNAAKGIRTPNGKPKNFGGGGGTGVSISPIGFLVISPDGDVELLNINNPENNRQNNIVDSISDLLVRSPEIISNLKSSFGSNKSGTSDTEDIFDDDKAQSGK